ncbi:helix-turn-helix domain-containing protein [Microbacterium sp. ASV49]|uniref:Helix-turn-helix transcriptional regulator n=1 Tax=Microbacterium candidum TaxID=3041922 RepID=A0ABT7MWK6_9MICO|nr:helix-turn-helix transcriptional regulator [Microbacterium sp. ASV49]MDL9978836.1 helix-turn-helix transcriptional regulator [Microbacterium sp. ASV49]
MSTIDAMRPSTGVGLARRMKTSRIWAGLEQAEIAARCGVSRSAVSAWEQGRTEPSMSNMVKWARAVGQSMEWFAEGVEETTTAPAEAGAVSLLSQHSARLEGLEPPTF